MSFMEWHDVTKDFDGTRALDGFSLTIDEGEILGILGPSGSGKSTLLRVTAGLETPSAGRILLRQQDMAGLPPHRRGFGLMFQEYCLFPHLSVKANVGFGLRMKGLTRQAQQQRVEEMLRLVRLRGFDRRDVLSLSGGEQQRVALARSLAPAPRLLMLDEPLGALDAALRETLLAELAEILREVSAVTVLYVTHDHEEAMTMGTRVALMSRGKLVQVGKPEQLISSPANAFVASFLGLGALIPAAWKRLEGAWVLETEVGVFPGSRVNARCVEVPRVDIGWSLLVRPEAVRFARRAGTIRVRARIIHRMVRPGGTSIRISLEGRNGIDYQLDCTLSGSGTRSDRPAPPEGETSVWLDPAACLPVSL